MASIVCVLESSLDSLKNSCYLLGLADFIFKSLYESDSLTGRIIGECSRFVVEQRRSYFICRSQTEQSVCDRCQTGQLVFEHY